jgi:acyl-CoA synthetase (NDP forming)
VRTEAITRLLEEARAEGRSTCLEPAGLEILKSIGIEIPRYIYVRTGRDAPAADLSRLPGEQVVVKVVSPQILHKRAVNGVRIVPKISTHVQDTMATIARDLGDQDVRGFTLHEFVPYSAALGSELLLAMRWTEAFGPIIVCGLGGVDTEMLARRLQADADLAITSARMSESSEWLQILRTTVVGDLLATQEDEQQNAVEWEALRDVYDKLQRAADLLAPKLLAELEINPLVLRNGRWTALDVLVRLPEELTQPSPARPIEKIENLLYPRSIAIVGVSRGDNPGHVILSNILRQGFAADRLYVVKRDVDSLEGCRAVPTVASLPETVDLLIVGVGANRALEVVEEATRLEKARSMIVISGGLGERAGTATLASEVRSTLARARQEEGSGPVINGANCLGIRSVPGNYDSLFIPGYKLRAPHQGTSPAVLISQSGALAVAKLSCLPGVDFRYCISVGNQLDLTLGDYLTFLKEDATLRLFAVYAEGFQPLDGLQFLRSAEEISRRGGDVLLYQGGRSRAGARAAATHTAAMAGDFKVGKALAEHAGLTVADSLEDFEDLIQIYGCLEKPDPNCRLAVISNAGFECVAAADNLGNLELAEFTPGTRDRLRALLTSFGVQNVVEVSNPLDLTPMANDAAFAEAVGAVLEDENVDAGVIGCVPLTPALNTLAAGPEHAEDVGREGSLADQMIRLRNAWSKPWVAVVDGGSDYEPMRALLKFNGVPTFRNIDQAMRMIRVAWA